MRQPLSDGDDGPMPGTTAWITAAAATAVDALAVAVPWARYGDMSFTADRFPGWPAYLVAAVLLHACVAVVLLSRSARRPAAAVAGALALGVARLALWMASRYDESSLFFASVTPMVMPMPGPGGALALLAALTSGAVAAIAGLRGLRQGGRPTAPAARRPAEA